MFGAEMNKYAMIGYYPSGPVYAVGDKGVTLDERTCC